MNFGSRRRFRGAMCGAIAAAVVGLAGANGAQATTLVRSPTATTSNDPAANLAEYGKWQPLANSPLGPVHEPVVVWTGTSLLEVGGAKSENLDMVPKGISTRGAALDPDTGTWSAIANGPAGMNAWEAASVWTGTQLFVYGSPGRGEIGQTTADLYNPASNTWTTTSPIPVKGLSGGATTVVWDGSEVILSATILGPGPANTDVSYVLAYNPATNVWTNIAPPYPKGHRPLGLTMEATDDGVLLWSPWSTKAPPGQIFAAKQTSGVDVFRLTNGQFHRVAVTWPEAVALLQPTSDGATVLLGPAYERQRTTEVNPVTLKRTKLPAGPLDIDEPQVFWAGSVPVEFASGELALWDAVRHKWLTGPDGPRSTSNLPLVWAGDAAVEIAGAKVYSFGVPTIG